MRLLLKVFLYCSLFSFSSFGFGALSTSLYAEVLKNTSGNYRFVTPKKQGEHLVFRLKVKKKHTFRRARLRYRFEGDVDYFKKDFIKEQKKKWIVRLPLKELRNRSLEYFLVIQNQKGQPFTAFGRPETPQKYQSEVDENNEYFGSVESEDIVKGHVLENASLEQQTLKQEFELRIVQGLGNKLTNQSLEQELQALTAFDEGLLQISSEHLPAQMLGQIYELKADEIAHLPARTLADLLRLLPGISWAQEITGFQSLSLRGGQGQQRISFEVDGVLIQNPLDGRFLLFYSPDMIESIKVYPAGSLQRNSTQSSGPLISIRSKTGHALWGNIALRSTLGLELAAGMGGQLAPHWQWHTSIFMNTEKGEQENILEDRFTDTPNALPAEQMKSNGQQIRGGLQASLDGKWLDWQIHTKYWGLYEARSIYIGIYDTVSPVSSVGNGHSVFNLSVEKSVTPFWDLKFATQLGHFYKQQYFQLSPAGYSTEDRNGDGEREVFEAGQLVRRTSNIVDFSFSANSTLHLLPYNRLELNSKINIAASPFGEKVEANARLDGTKQKMGEVTGLDIDLNKGCVFLGTAMNLPSCRMQFLFDLNDSQFFGQRFFVKAGLRVQLFSDLNFDIAHVLQPYLFAEYQPVDFLWLFTSASQGSRAPTFLERFDFSPFVFDRKARGDFVGNKDLRAEIVRQAELGMRTRLKLLDVDYHFSANIFAKQVTGSIEYIPVNGTYEQVHNFGDAYWVGTELNGHFKLKNGTGIKLNWSWNRGIFNNNTEIEDLQPCSVSKTVAGVSEEGDMPACSWLTDTPQMLANVIFFWNAGKLGTFSSTAHFISERRNSARSALERIRFYKIPAAAVFNVSYHSMYFYNVMGFYVDIYNLLDADWRDPLPRPDRMPGLVPRQGMSLYFGFKFRLID